MSLIHVVLVPGFFSFDTIGVLRYFHGVTRTLEEHFKELGVDATVHELVSLPTASIRRRASYVKRKLAELAGSDDYPVHVIAHSTGALDVRLMLTPTADLPDDVGFPVQDRIRSVVSISAPHFGTPLARFLGSAPGQVALRTGSLVFFQALTRLRWPTRLGLKAWRWSSKLDDYLGLKNTVADELIHALGELSDHETAPLLELLRGIERDQALLFQLTEQACDLLNAATANPPGVRCASVVTRAPRPSLRALMRFRHDIYAQTTYAVYSVVHHLTARTETLRPELLRPEQLNALREIYGAIPAPEDNDGIVPTLSQVWGEVLCAERADHLDSIGHFGLHEPGQAKGDWLPSGSDFDTQRFRALWRRVAEHIAAG